MTFICSLQLILLEHPACEILDRHIISDPTFQNNLLSLTSLLYTEKIVNKKVWSSKERNSLLNDVQNAVCQNYQLLKTLAVILQKSTTTVRVGNAIMNEYSKLVRVLILLYTLLYRRRIHQ